MAYEVELPESMDAGGGEFIEKGGWYHLAVTAVDENPVGKNGQMISGFKASVSVLGGENADQLKKTADLTLWNPKPDDKNNGEMAKKKQGRFLAATCVIDPTAKLTPGQKITVDINLAVGRQFVARLEMREPEKKFADFHYADIYHVDDPAVKDVPKNQGAINLFKAFRRPPESFKKADGSQSQSKAGAASGNGSATTTKAATGAGSSVGGQSHQPLDVNSEGFSL